MSTGVEIHKVDTSGDPQISLSPAAIAHVEAWQGKQQQVKGIRLSVKTTGCSGLSYVIDWAEQIHEDDCVSQITPTLAVYVARKDLTYLKSTHLDYVKEGLNHKWLYENPNQKGACGCGESFTV